MFDERWVQPYQPTYSYSLVNVVVDDDDEINVESIDGKTERKNLIIKFVVNLLLF